VVLAVFNMSAFQNFSFSFRRFRRCALATAVLLGLSLLAAAAAALFPNALLCKDSGPVKADVIVVLGGGWPERSKRAAELFNEHEAPAILVSGVGDCERNRKFLLEAGVPAKAIEEECESRTTHENAQFSVKRLREEKVQRVIVVTTWYHSRRALACFRHSAPEIQFYSRPSYFAWPRADWKRKGISRYIRLEYVKLIGYWVRYGICPI
jgi:uncharacterized SAM-binding protein YcdF (DUF218 family)